MKNKKKKFSFSRSRSSPVTLHCSVWGRGDHGAVKQAYILCVQTAVFTDKESDKSGEIRERFKTWWTHPELICYVTKWLVK